MKKLIAIALAIALAVPVFAATVTAEPYIAYWRIGFPANGKHDMQKYRRAIQDKYLTAFPDRDARISYWLLQPAKIRRVAGTYYETVKIATVSTGHLALRLKNYVEGVFDVLPEPGGDPVRLYWEYLGHRDLAADD